MTYTDTIEHVLRNIEAPRRNHYYYAKMMDVRQFEMEQVYGNAKRWLLNRLTLGDGVACGLRVQAVDGQLCVEPGFAIDPLGREILVPVKVCVDPWNVSDECGTTLKQLSKDEGHVVHLSLCYYECLTDLQPVLLSECDTEQGSAAGTVVESFRLQVNEGLPDELVPALDLDCCRRLVGIPVDEPVVDDPEEAGPIDDDAAVGGGGQPAQDDEREKRRRIELCECLSGACPMPEGECVVLATVQLEPGGEIGQVDLCTFRKRVYSNQVLAELVLCLARRLEECCDGEEPEPTEGIRVSGVQLMDNFSETIATLTDPAQPMKVAHEDNGVYIRLVFTDDVDAASLTADPGGAEASASLLVRQVGVGSVPGMVGAVGPRSVLWTHKVALAYTDFFDVGTYEVTLFGDDDASGQRPTVSSTGGVALDGEPVALPSGEGTPGGNFTFQFEVTGGDTPEPSQVVQVEAIELISPQDVVVATLVDPTETLHLGAGTFVSAIRVTFTDDVLAKTIKVEGSSLDAGTASFEVVKEPNRTEYATLTLEGNRAAVWKTHSELGRLTAGSFTVTLHGEDDPSGERPAIQGVLGTNLDGEPLQLPSGDGTPGGNFEFTFTIED